eukprot:Em0064g8a
MATPLRTPEPDLVNRTDKSINNKLSEIVEEMPLPRRKAQELRFLQMQPYTVGKCLRYLNMSLLAQIKSNRSIMKKQFPTEPFDLQVFTQKANQKCRDAATMHRPPPKDIIEL